MRPADPRPVVSSGGTAHRRRGRLVTAGACVLACALAACDSSPEKRLSNAAQRVASWSTAAEMAGDSWSARVVPRRYAEAAAQAAQRGIEEERTGLAGEPETLAEERVASSVREMSELSVLAARLEAAVRSGDRTGAGEIAHQIGARGRALRDATGR